MHEIAGWFLDRKIADGAMDFVGDYANPVPAVITLDRMGSPSDTWEVWSHTMQGVSSSRK
jgi:hypothetical protein